MYDVAFAAVQQSDHGLGIVWQRPSYNNLTGGFYDKALANFLQINIGKISIPTGSLLFFAFLAFLMWAFLHTKPVLP